MKMEIILEETSNFVCVDVRQKGETAARFLLPIPQSGRMTDFVAAFVGDRIREAVHEIATREFIKANNKQLSPVNSSPENKPNVS